MRPGASSGEPPGALWTPVSQTHPTVFPLPAGDSHPRWVPEGRAGRGLDTPCAHEFLWGDGLLEQQGHWLTAPGSEGAPKRGELGQLGWGTSTCQSGPQGM